MTDPASVTNLEKANSDLKLTPQEQFLYGHHLNNIATRQGTNNPDGSFSTLRAMTVGIDGKTYVLPTVWHGQVLSPPDAIAQAKAKGLSNWPHYDTEAEAKGRYGAMHEYLQWDKPLPPVAREANQPEPLSRQRKAFGDSPAAKEF